MPNAPTIPTAQACLDILWPFFEKYPNDALRNETCWYLVRLLAMDLALHGELKGWMAGLIYAVDNDARVPSGVRGVPNREFEAAFGVPMRTVRDRAAQLRRHTSFWK